MNGLRRVVFDTGTLVSVALRIGSVPHQALLQAFASADVCASGDTLAELDRVLKRKKFNCYRDAELRLAFTALVRRNARLFEVPDADTIAVRPSCRDANDNKFLALAKIAEADAIVSSDEDLLILHPWRGIPILSPAHFLGSVAVGPDPKDVR
ncbi:MAG: putative toxin-antitoxin system toxin component, PIN family [Acidobacteriaceae bacterium]